MQTLDSPASDNGFHFLTSNGSAALAHYLEVECSLVSGTGSPETCLTPADVPYAVKFITQTIMLL